MRLLVTGAAGFIGSTYVRTVPATERPDPRHPARSPDRAQRAAGGAPVRLLVTGAAGFISATHVRTVPATERPDLAILPDRRTGLSERRAAPQ